MTAKTYRKKPIEIQAVQWTGTNIDEVIEFIGEHPPVDRTSLVINTIEGDMFAAPGWWIIRGIQGEYYPCKPDIFADSYDLVETE